MATHKEPQIRILNSQTSDATPDIAQMEYGELAINDNSGIGNVLTVYINDDGAGSAGNRAYGLVVTVIGYWNIL